MQTSFSFSALELIATIGTPVEDLQAARVAEIQSLQWISPDTIVYSAKNGTVSCYNVSTQTQQWAVHTTDTILCATAGADAVFVLNNAGTIFIYSKSNGELQRKLAPDFFVQLSGEPFFRAINIGWIPIRNQLIISRLGLEYGDNTYILDGQNLTLVEKIKSEGDITNMTFSPNGSHVTFLSKRKNIRIWDVDKHQEVLKIGAERAVPTDAPFASNAFYDGVRLVVYSVDNGWTFGSVHVHDILVNNELARFSSQNLHLVMDVDFTNKRIALAGTSTELALVDFTGNLLAKQTGVALHRTLVVRFSPDNSKIAIGNMDTTVRVFQIKE